jgi:hypothetical protein
VIQSHYQPEAFCIDELLAEKEKYKSISEELDQTFAELAGF